MSLTILSCIIESISDLQTFTQKNIMKNTIKFALVGAILATIPVATAADCYAIAKIVAKEIESQPKQVLSIVSEQVKANESCACEIVKAAIVTTEADKKLVAKIVEQAIEAAPKKLSLITTCALAVAPDAHAEVMEVAAKYSKGTGEGSSAKDSTAKDGSTKSSQFTKPIASFSPLDFIGLDSTSNFSPIQIFLPDSGGQTTPGNVYSQP